MDDTVTGVNVYATPELYDLENTDADELPLLLRLAQSTGGPILDLACGTGRTTLPLAAAGYEVIGVDASRPMLERARQKARDAGLSVDFVEQDCAQLELSTTARMATMTGNAFQEFLTNDEQDALLESVAAHLAPGGLFVFDTRFPSAANVDRPPGEQPWSTVTARDGRTITVSVIWGYDAVSQLQDYVFIERITDSAGATDEKRSLGRLRYTWPMEMPRLLAGHGFALEAIHGAWDATPLVADSREMVVIARRLVRPSGRSAR